MLGAAVRLAKIRVPERSAWAEAQIEMDAPLVACYSWVAAVPFVLVEEQAKWQVCM